jgi:hypothetical protein
MQYSHWVLNTQETIWANSNVCKWNLQYSAHRLKSDKFPIQNGLKQDALSLMFFNFALEYAIRRVQENQKGLKLNETHQTLAYAH